MRRLVLLTALSLLVPAAAASAAPRFSGVALGNGPRGVGAKHAFVVGDGYTIRLRDRTRGRTPYRVCLARDNRRLRCSSGSTGPKGRRGSFGSRFAIAPGSTGPYVYRWFVGGRNVAQWRVRIGVGD